MRSDHPSSISGYGSEILSPLGQKDIDQRLLKS